MYFIGIDVGTGSARAAIFDARGQLLGTDQRPIEAFRPKPDFVQQSSAGIWAAIAASTQGALAVAGVQASAVTGIGFDATCSLVVCDADDRPVSVSPDGAPEQDIIVWMDHRAMSDAREINSIGGEPLKHVGGVISPEMELPKLRWLKREMPDAYARAERFWDLPDWLVHRATGGETRSFCSTVCKWTYLGHKGTTGEGWDGAFLADIGLGDLAEDNHAAIGNAFAAPGEKVGVLSEKAADELGLVPGIAVAASLIDAYAGALGTLGVSLGDEALDKRLAMIAGTSTCHINLTEEPAFVPGIWGPYYSVLIPSFWANEGGQSAAGALIDAVLARHSATAALKAEASQRGVSHFMLLDQQLEAMAGAGGETAVLTHSRHVQPDFHGNRSPLADPSRKGAISGLTLNAGLDDLALDYLATIQALAYGTRHILETLERQGVVIDTLVMSGGLARSKIFLRENADATGCRVVVPEQAEPVLLGSAMLGAVAAGEFPDLKSAMRTMSGESTTVLPRNDVADYHDRKYRVFRRMQRDFADYAKLMA